MMTNFQFFRIEFDRRCALMLTLSAGMAFAQQTETTQEVQELETVTVTGIRPTDAGPLPGLIISKDQVPGNIQNVTKHDLKESRTLSLGDFMNSQMQSVNVNDYSGNPFQVDINYRGFTASPQIGSPQGLSVFFDGIRVNEPFGDVVNWDLIPLNAIERFDLFPGSNPLFGLNTLGGALSLRTKSGFTAPGVDVQVLGGSFGRKQLQLSGGANNGTLGGFAALQWFDEDGWRDDSPSKVNQFFSRGDWRGRFGQLTGSVLLAKTDLIGNGLIPIELHDQRRETVFTSPDETKNKLIQFAISGALDFSEDFNITGQVYRRDSDRRGLNGDIYEGFDEFAPSEDFRSDPGVPTGGLPVCQYTDSDGDGIRNFDLVTLGDGTIRRVTRPPINGVRQVSCDHATFPNRRPRNGGGFNSPTAAPELRTGVVEGTPIGLLTNTEIDQITTGGAVQFNWNLTKHKFMIGASVDRSEAEYSNRQRLGLIDASHRVYADPENIDPIYRAAQIDIPINAFEGATRTRSLYFSETWSPVSNVHLTLASRYNHTRIKNRLDTRLGTDLHEIRNRQPPFILCPTEDPASCPDSLQIYPNNLSRERVSPTQEEYIFESLNPSVGMNWLPTPNTNLYFNFSRGTRAPSVVELGCAFDSTPVDINAGLFDDDGVPLPSQLQPRSLLGPTCTLPSTLSGDPFLPQIKATSYEVGARGKLFQDWDWNFSLYRTDLRDDIYFIGVSAERSYFDTIGKTRRQGLELGLNGKVGKAEIKLNYSLVDATYQSRFFILSPRNSSADFDEDSQPGSPTPSPTANDNNGVGTYRMTRVDPGARIPGIPLHNFNASFSYKITKGLSAGISMISRSRSFARGNENNAHRSEGSDEEFSSSAGIVTRPGRDFTKKGHTPGFAIFNLDITYRLKHGWSLFAQVSNLFDKEYFTASRLGVTPFSASENGAIGPSGWNYNSSEWDNTTFVGPGAKRGIWLGASYEFDPRR